LLVALLAVAIAPTSSAGMAAPPTLREWAKLRLQNISFFAAVLLISAALIRFVWNRLRTDFPRLPRLTYPKALGLIALWGLLFLLVLAMISGARELLTPGAWKRDGPTHRLTEGQP
jgi:hypothetical protein